MNLGEAFHPHLAFLNSGGGLSTRCGKVGEALVDSLLCEAHITLPHSGRAAPRSACERLDDVLHDLGMGVGDVCALVLGPFNTHEGPPVTLVINT